MYTAPPTLPRTDLPGAVLAELGAIARESREPSVNAVLLKSLAASPAKLYDGLLALADGTNWNPGHGAGVYVYQGGAWLPLYGFAPTFTAPTLLNSWVNYGAGTGTAGYYKDPFGRVHLKGLVKDGAVDVPIFTLPAGFRPSEDLLFVADASSGVGHTPTRVDVLANGNVVERFGMNTYTSLNGLSFAAV